MKRFATLFLSLVLAAAAGCSDDDPVEVKTTRLPWPDMIAKDDVITTLLLCYENPWTSESMTRYEAMLHSQYFFALDDQDVNPPDPGFLSRAEDIAATRAIFENQTLLELSLSPETGGTWETLPDLEGEPCENCWAGLRGYVIRAQFGGDETIYQSSPGAMSVTIVVAPDEIDPSKWAVRAMYDMSNY